ncbi:MAG: DUF5916 domain-containing protein [Bacteroidia bacterium]|jgi:hypothetical protein
MRSLFLILASYFFSAILVARSSDSLFIGKTGKMPVVYSESPILVDGELNEPVWQSTFVSRPFVQYFPYDTSLAKSQTQVAFSYDEKHLYFAVKCFDRNPEKQFVIQSLKRDFSVTNSDGVVLTLSTFKDGQNGFSFGVTPYNSQREGSVEGGGGFGVTTAWDQVWHSATQLKDGYWTAEFSIPFNSIRFTPGVSVWGFNVTRFDFKNNEVSNYARVPRNFNVSSLVFCDSMQFISSLVSGDTVQSGGKPLFRKNRNFVFIPYVSGMTSQQGILGSRTRLNDPITGSPKIGFDAKLGVTRSLNLDITANPDFAQVDVDVQQINLTRYNLFFPERRQFFIENSDLFAGFGFRQIRPFFSRRIGSSDYGAVPILGGVRLSGKLGDGLRVGAMNITTRSIDVKDGSKVVHLPAVNYTVASLQKKVFSASNVALIWVHDQKLGVQKVYTDKKGNRDSIGDYNSVVGGEFNLLTKNNQWGGKAFIQKSFYPGLHGLEGFAHATWLRYKSLHWMAMWNHEYVSRSFIARTGFVPRTDNIDAKTGKFYRFSYYRLEPNLGYTWYPKNKLINNHGLSIYNSSYYDSTFGVTESTSELGYDAVFQKSAIFHLSLDHNYYNLFLPFDPLNRKLFFFGKYQWIAIHPEFTTNSRKRLSAFCEVIYGGYFQGTKTEFNGNINFRAPRFGKLKLPKLLLTANWNHINIMLPDSMGTSKINLLGLKAEYSLSTTRYITGFLQYNTQTEKMNVNIRFQWRYRPMSDIFLVFSQNYNRFNSVLPNHEMYMGPSYRSLAAKWVYWFN